MGEHLDQSLSRFSGIRRALWVQEWDYSGARIGSLKEIAVLERTLHVAASVESSSTKQCPCSMRPQGPLSILYLRSFLLPLCAHSDTVLGPHPSASFIVCNMCRAPYISLFSFISVTNIMIGL